MSAWAAQSTQKSRNSSLTRILYVGQASVAARTRWPGRAHDSAGNVLFSRTIESVGGDSALVALVADEARPSPPGARRAHTDVDALVVRLDSAGTVEWRRDIDGDAAGRRRTATTKRRRDGRSGG